MNFRQLASLFLLGIIWGASFLFIKVAVVDIPPFTLVLGRTSLAALVLYLVIRYRGRNLPPFGSIWGSFFIMGLFNGAIPYSLINWGETQIEAGLGAIFNSLMPLFTVIFAHYATRDERFTGRKLTGVVLGLAGVVVLMGPSILMGLGSRVLGQLAVAGAAVSYAVAVIYGKRLGKDAPLVLATGQMIAGALLVAPLSLLFDRPWALSPSPVALASLACLALLGTAYAYVVYYRLLAQIGATNLSLVTYIIPLSGVFWGYLLLGERLHWSALAAMGLIMASVAMVSDVRIRDLFSQLHFDPFGWFTHLLPEKHLHRLIRWTMASVCLVFLVMRISQYRGFLLKPLWAVETLVFIVLVAAFLVRDDPVDRARGVGEVFVPLVGALLPFFLLFSPPVPWILNSRPLMLAVFWWMTLATGLTVWGMWTLRRSFSITVEARTFISGGPYRWVRHPIYLGEILTAGAVAAWRLSIANMIIFSAFVTIQLFRSRMEEGKLARSFPEYEVFKAKTWWFF